MKNSVSIIGYLGQDPVSRQTQSGKTVTNLSVATTDKWKDKVSGDLKEETQWHQIVIWGKSAEFAARYLRAGSKVAVDGSIQYRKYVDKDGMNRKSTEIKCDTILALDKREGFSLPSPTSAAVTNTVAAQFADEPVSKSTDDLPF
jgi:single-strand DNA-binding protein